VATQSLSHQNIRVAIYARVSTTNHGQDTAVQNAASSKEYIRAPWLATRRRVRRHRHKRTKEKRPELDRLMSDAYKRRFGHCFAFGVLTDLPAPSLTYSELWRHLRRWGLTSFRSRSQMDTSTPAGKMVFTVLGAVAELERSLIVERVRAECAR